MRRTVATRWVVATALLMAVPVGASDAPTAGPVALPAAPPAVELPTPVTALPVAPTPVTAVQAPAVAAPAAPPAARPAVKSPRAKALARAGLTDEAYAARLQAELCMARQIFCGLDHSGRYPAR